MIKVNQILNEDCFKFLERIDDKSIDLIVIDPPYNELPKSWDKFTQWDKLNIEFNRVLKENGQLYIFGKQPMLSHVLYELTNFEFRFELVWVKEKGNWASNYMPMRLHELIWCFKKRGIKTTDLFFDIESIKTPGEPYIRKNKVISTTRNNWKANHTIIKDGRRFPLSVIRQNSVSSKNKNEGTSHPTQKPLAILDWIIKSSSKKNDLVVDCFLGSGTTAVSCKKLNRNYLGCDIDPEFIRIAKERIKKA